jgi:hypothetical protein
VAFLTYIVCQRFVDLSVPRECQCVRRRSPQDTSATFEVRQTYSRLLGFGGHVVECLSKPWEAGTCGPKVWTAAQTLKFPPLGVEFAPRDGLGLLLLPARRDAQLGSSCREAQYVPVSRGAGANTAACATAPG